MHFWNGAAMKANLMLFWNRLTFSRITTAYILFSISHFVIQLAFQIKAFTINAEAAAFLYSIVQEGKTTSDNLPFLDGNQLHLCSWVSSSINLQTDTCPVVWSGGQGNNTLGASITDSLPQYGSAVSAPSSSSSSSPPENLDIGNITTSLAAVRVPQTQTVTVFVRPQTTVSPTSSERPTQTVNKAQETTQRANVRRDTLTPSAKGSQVGVILNGMGFDHVPATLDSVCLWSLNWPVSVLDNTKREDIVFISFQFWVLGMSFLALLNESIPHIIASLLTHLLATAWGAFQIVHTASFRADFNRVITHGACNGVSLLPNYWKERGLAEIPSLALNVFSLFVSFFLTWRLIKAFGWQTFKRVGASLVINRVYKLVLVLSIIIQLSLFFMVVTVSLWLDQLLNSGIGDVVMFLTLYKISCIITLILLVPWLMAGWFGVRKELRAPMFIFLLLSFLYLGGWGVMFFSTTFRWTFVTWRFFSIISTASVFLTILAFILGVVCRFNFGKGLLRYLNAQEMLPGDDSSLYDDDGSDIEKVDFPSTEKPIPTFSDAFGVGAEVPLPSQMFPARLQLGPRFFNQHAEPFETPSDQSPVTPPSNALLRGGSQRSTASTLSADDQHGSDGHISTLPSYHTVQSDKSTHAHSNSRSQKRWIIE